ncbi:LOW QUALITY PROTEIN: hypothetical protein QTO34_000412, partial [Cnephaeus nilssonii]
MQRKDERHLENASSVETKATGLNNAHNPGLQPSPARRAVKAVTGKFPISITHRRGLKPLITQLLGQGLLIPIDSPCNTPILPHGTYRLVQDLRLINEAVVPIHPVVPNPYTLLSCIPSGSTHFSVLDLKDAFFTIPLDPDSYYVFAFTWEDPDEQVSRQLTWTALARDLQQCSLEPSTLLQYVDDLLLCSPSLDISRRQTAGLLDFLGDKGYRVSPAKAQLSAPTVTYLGIGLTVDRAQAIRDLQPPTSAEQILSFLGLVGFFRHWVPNFALLAKPLYQAAKETPIGPLSSPSLICQAFSKLRDALLASPPLSLPDISKPFQLFTDEKQGIAMGVLTQPLGPAFTPVAYLSRQLDPMVRGWQPCLRALAAAAALTKEAQKICLQQPLQVFSTHRLQDLLSHRSLSLLAPSRMQELHLLFLESPDISLTQYPALNPATLLPAASTKPVATHSCPKVIEALTQPQAELSDLPLSNPDLTLWMEAHPQGRRKASYVVVTLKWILEAAQLPEGTTSQKAELRCQGPASGRREEAHCHTVIWRERGFLSTKGSPIINARLITCLLYALQLPSQVAIVHCQGHQTDSSMVTRGNTRADTVARGLTQGEGSPAPVLFLSLPSITPQYTEEEKNKLLQRGGSSGPEGWIFINNKTALPKAQVGAIAQQIHQSLHIGPLALWRFLEPLFTSPTLREAVTSACSSSTCAAVPPQGGMRPNFPTHQMRGHLPGQDWQVDFIHMPPHKKTKYLLTMVDTLTGWVEAFSTRKETAEVVAETLITHIIPRFGLPTSIQSDNGPAFISRVVQQVSTSLGSSWKLHIPYRPQSSVLLNSYMGDPSCSTIVSLLTLLSWLLIFHNSLYSGSCSGNTLTGFCPGQNQLTKANEDNPSSPRTQFSNLHPKALEPRWMGLHTVILTTPTAAKLLGDPSWHHLSRLKRIQEQHDFYKSLGNLHPPPPAYVWRFKVRETYDQDSTQVTRQRNPNRCNRDVNTYGGCRWSGCVIHDAYNEVRSGPFFWKDGTFNIRIRDPWDQRWVAGVMGKLNGDGWSSSPSGTIYISREYVMAQKAQIQVSNSILQVEHFLKGKLPDFPWVEVLSSWLQLIQHTLLFLNETRTLPNVSHCFLCVSLQRLLLAAVPLMTPPGTQGHGECQPSLAGIPLWEPETPEPTLPPWICYQTSNPVTVGQVTWNCTQNHTAASPTKASPGTFFWCNGTLSNCINSSDPGPCFGVTVVPQLTLYGESELAWLLHSSHPRAHRAAFLPVMLGLGGRGGPREQHSLCSLESTTTSLASLQRQVTLVAQIALQNRRALELLTAERGGTCMFLQEECCYYIKESRVVEQNVQTLTKLSEELRARHSRDNSLFSWLQSPLATWILPLIGPLILICVFLSLAPCLLKFISSQIAEMSPETEAQGAGLRVAGVADWASVCAMAAPEAFGRPGAPADSRPGPPRSKAKAGDLAGCLLRCKAFRKPPQRRRLSESLGHRQTASPLVHQ